MAAGTSYSGAPANGLADGRIIRRIAGYRHHNLCDASSAAEHELHFLRDAGWLKQWFPSSPVRRS